MRIGELSRRTGVSTRLLRYYEERGLLAAERGANGYRAYDEEAVVRVRQIRALLAAGLTARVIREVLPCARGERPEIELCAAVRTLLGEELTALDDRIDDLRRTRGNLAGYLSGG